MAGKIKFNPPNMVSLIMIERKWGSIDAFLAKIEQGIKVEELIYVVGILRNQDKLLHCMPKEEAEEIIMQSAVEITLTDIPLLIEEMTNAFNQVTIPSSPAQKKNHGENGKMGRQHR